MKVLFLIDNLSKGGKERRMLALVKGLLQGSNYEIEIVIFKNKIEYLEIEDLDLTLHILERKPKYNPLVFGRLYKICKNFEPDLIHCWSTMTAIFAFPSIKLLRIPILNSSIAEAPNNLKIWQKKLLLAKLTFLYSNCIVGNSKAGLKAFGAPDSKSHCVYNGYDFNRSKNIVPEEKIRNKYAIGYGQIIGKIAAFANRKDYDTYIKAALIVLTTNPNVKFFAIGKGPDLERIKKLVPAAFKDNIIFTGALTDVESLINIFNIGVLSTNAVAHGEGISNSIMEYMALAKPVIASEGGGTNEIVQHNVTGYLVPPNTPQAMAERILQLIEDPEKAELMGLAGKKSIEENFNISKMITTYSTLYKQLLFQNN